MVSKKKLDPSSQGRAAVDLGHDLKGRLVLNFNGILAEVALREVHPGNREYPQAPGGLLGVDGGCGQENHKKTGSDSNTTIRHGSSG
jgi:hypothetical protein